MDGRIRGRRWRGMDEERERMRKGEDEEIGKGGREGGWERMKTKKWEEYEE